MNKDTFHYKWSKSHEPVLHVKSGDVVNFEVNDVTSWAITKKSKVEDLSGIKNEKLYPLAGPVYVEGASPGDTLVVDIERVQPSDWGFTAILPGLGLLSEEFSEPDLYVWDLSRSKSYAAFRKGIKVPLAPFCGVMGVAPPENGYFEVLPPGKHGGNLDIRHLTDGSRLMLPVFNVMLLALVMDILPLTVRVVPALIV